MEKKDLERVVNSQKELNKPEWVSNDPLDKTFERLAELIKLAPNEDAVDVLYSRIRPEERADHTAKTVVVMETLLEYLAEIQRHAATKKAKLGEDMISIALHDMKLLGALTNLIVVNGVYASLPSNVGIPLDKRRLKSFDRAMKFARVPQPHNVALLQRIVRSMVEVFRNGGDVRDLMLKGTGFTDVLTSAVYLLTRPGATDTERQEFSQKVQLLESQSDTYDLFLVYSLLMPSSAVYFRSFVAQRLARLAAERRDGVQAVIEYIGGLRDNEEISVEKIDHITRVLLQRSPEMTPRDYFANIGEQLYNILVFVNRPVMTSVAAHIVESIYSINQRIVVDFVLQRIWTSFNPEKPQVKLEEDGVLTSETALNNAFNVFLSFTKNGSPEVMNALLGPLIVPLWSYLNYQKQRGAEQTAIVQNGIISALHIANDVKWLDAIVQHLIVQDGGHWEFGVGAHDLTLIRSKPVGISQLNETKIFGAMEQSTDLLMEILKDIDDDLVEEEFLKVLRRWLKVNDSGTERLLVAGEDEADPFATLVDLRVLESITEKHRDRLSKSPDSMLDVVISVLEGIAKAPSRSEVATIVKRQDADSDDEDSDDEEQDISQESLLIVLQLLSAILSETEELSTASSDKLKTLKLLLEKLANDKAATALLSRVDEMLDGSEGVVKKGKNPDEAVLERAITSLNDPLVPIRAHGLYLLRQLIEKNSDIVSVDFVVNLHLNQLQDPEPFVYLNVIKGLDMLLEMSKDVLPQFLEIYKSPEADIDERLRIGEVLLRFINRSDETLTGDTASRIASATLGLVRRNETTTVDDRMRMSAMSLLGVCCRVSPAGMLDFLADTLDCALGILRLETEKDRAVMRRSAIVLLNDLISSSAGLYSVPKGYAQSCLAALKYVKDTDNDVLVRHQASEVLEHITELLRDSLGL